MCSSAAWRHLVRSHQRVSLFCESMHQPCKSLPQLHPQAFPPLQTAPPLQKHETLRQSLYSQLKHSPHPHFYSRNVFLFFSCRQSIRQYHSNAQFARVFQPLNSTFKSLSLILFYQQWRRMPIYLIQNLTPKWTGYCTILLHRHQELEGRNRRPINGEVVYIV